MKPTILLLVFFSFSLAAMCQKESKPSDLNLDFEDNLDSKFTGWNVFGSPGYLISTDAVTAYSGEYAAVIEYTDGTADFKALGFTLPDNFDGKEITLTGYIKTENVTDGYGGLWLRLDPNIGFDNMRDRGVTGTTDWKKYSITLPMAPAKTKQIVIGGLLVGKGKMWIDNLEVTVDGKKISMLQPYGKIPTAVDLDTEFVAGSRITDVLLSAHTTESLKLLGLTWGFVKYYHPAIAAGKHNWDFELFRVLPDILRTSSPIKRDQVLVDWITKLGPIEKDSSTVHTQEECKMQPDLGWITDPGLSKNLRETLQSIKHAKRTGEHYYVGLEFNVKNPDFTNENPYNDIIFPDTGYRLLSLFRYWNIIQYYFPYRNLIQEDWKDVLVEFIPKFIRATDANQYTLTTLELIARIHDTHANIWGGNKVLRAYYGANYAPLELTFIENKAVVTSYLHEDLGKISGLQIGDIITAINGKMVEDIVQANLKVTAASNYPTQLRDIASRLLRTPDSTITIDYKHEGQVKSKVLKAYSSDVMNVYAKYQMKDTCFKMVEEDIAYISNGSLKGAYLPKLWKDFKDTKGLIIDNRNYPSDFLVFELSSYLVPESRPFVKFSKGSTVTPGLFTYTEPIVVGGDRNETYQGKVVILVNETSQSSSEYHAMAYRVAPHAMVIGSTTAGADGNVSRFVLPGGITTMISGIGVYYPDGRETQRVGIIPDIEVRPTITGILQGRDEVLEKAIEIINKG